MDVEELEILLKKKYTLKEIAKETGRSQTTVRYWIKKHNLKLFRGPKGKLTSDRSQLTFKCSCGETDPDKFYGHKKSICASCHNQYTIKKGQEKRDKAREYLGNKCQACGFDKYKCSLDIHHTDPSVKDPNFASMRGWTWEKRRACTPSKCY